MVAESDIIPKDDDDIELTADNEAVEEEKDYEAFEDFEEVSIDGSCSTAKTTKTTQSGLAIFSPDKQLQLLSAAVDEDGVGRAGSSTEASTPSVIFMCKTCQIYFPVRRMLETHMSTVHDDAIKAKREADKWAERNARAGYLKLDDGNYSCRYCDYKAPGRTTVSTHVGRKHGRRRALSSEQQAAKEPRQSKRPKSSPKPKKVAATASGNDDADSQPVYITKVVMTVDNLAAAPPESQDYEAEAAAEEEQLLAAENLELLATMSSVGGTSDTAAGVGAMEAGGSWHVPEATNEEEVAELSKVGHVRRMCEYSCPYCRYETRKRADMHAHITDKHNEAWYESVAQQEAEREQRKQRDTYNPEDGRHHCHYCPFSASSRPTLNTHTRRKHKGFVQPYRSRKMAPVEFHCDQCDFTTRYRHKIQAHIERKHVAEPRYSCEYCGRKYKTKSDLTSHMRFQHFQQALVCELCGKVCSNSNALHIHKKREHFKPDFECQICKRRMVSQANLDEHVQRQHTDKQHYMCEQCGKVFDQPCKLKQHAMTHTGERPNICHICGKAFARRAVFRQHLLIHSGERPYICDICGKAFTQKPGLICHRKSHPGDKPPLPVVYIDSILDKFLSKG